MFRTPTNVAYNKLIDFRWETSEEGAELLLSYGIEYDHSASHHDCQMYWLRVGDTWTKIDYERKAEEWMKPLVRGRPTGLVEIPGSWYIDDLPPMMFIKKAANSHGWVNPRDVEAIWLVRLAAPSLVSQHHNVDTDKHTGSL